MFELDNRGKRSVVLDLTTDDGKAAALDLLDAADVFVTNVRRVGAARASASTTRRCWPATPASIYGHITGFGREGPDADKAAFDIAAFWSRAGIAHLLTPPGGTLPFQRGGMGDHNTGSTFAGGICAALFHREKTGEGQLVSSSLYRQGVYTVELRPQHGARLGPPPGDRRARDDGQPVGQQLLGRLTAATSGSSASTAPATGRRSPASSATRSGSTTRASPPPLDRAMHAAELIALLDEAFATKTLDEWAPLFDAEPDMFWSRSRTRSRSSTTRRCATPAASSRSPTGRHDADDRHARSTSTARRGRPAAWPPSSASTPPRSSRELGR